jgi:aspartate dehydrogenase
VILKRIGLIGMGYIGRHVYQRITTDPSLELEIAFIFNRSTTRLADYPQAVVLEELSEAASRSPDLIVEMAHPSITQVYGEAFLESADYLVLSVTALADAALHARLEATAVANDTRLFVPHGALVGAESLFESRERWADVSITFRKHPRNIDFSNSDLEPATIAGATVIYDGPVRGIAAQFPRNVNSMVTCALASVGLDRCRGVLIADPALEVAVAEVRAIGHTGEVVETVRRQPIIGVSGTEMLDSQLRSILRAIGERPGTAFV